MRWLALVLTLWATALGAVEPDEMLEDPTLEARAREISAGLRCPICQNESIDESSAPIARDLRLLVRERLVAGDSDGQVVDFVVARYGEFVKLSPDMRGANLVLWLAAPLAFFAAFGGLILARRSKVTVPDTSALSVEEQRRLDDLLNK